MLTRMVTLRRAFSIFRIPTVYIHQQHRHASKTFSNIHTCKFYCTTSNTPANTYIKEFLEDSESHNDLEFIKRIFEELIGIEINNYSKMANVPRLREFLESIATYMENSKQLELDIGQELIVFLLKVHTHHESTNEIQRIREIVPFSRLFAATLKNLYTHFDELDFKGKAIAVSQAHFTDNPLAKDIIDRSIEYLKNVEEKDIKEADVESVLLILSGYKAVNADTSPITDKLEKLILSGYDTIEDVAESINSKIARISLIQRNQIQNAQIADKVFEDIALLIKGKHADAQILEQMIKAYGDILPNNSESSKKVELESLLREYAVPLKQ